MRRLLIAIATAIISISASAQEHMKFKGIEMNCDIKTFISKLEAEGFEQDEIDGLPFLRGEFSGDDALVTVLDNYDGIVCGVSAFLDYNDCSWGTILDGLKFYEEGLTKKYGRPKQVIKKFKYPYQKGSGYELTGFKLGKNQYSITWETKIGHINLIFASATNTMIVLTYVDKVNSEADIEKEYRDL